MAEQGGALGVMLLAHEMRRHLVELFADETWMAEKGFRPPCAGVLRAISEAGPLSQREISDLIGLDPSDLVGAIDILEKAGLVERQRDPDDRRRHAVRVTEEGARAAGRVRELMTQAEDEALARLSDDERARLGVLLQKALGDRGERAAAAGATMRRLPVS
jgi:DNA-binding MarR family transcriptional regulator